MNGVRSSQTLSAKPCSVIQRRSPTPIEPILRSLTHTPVRLARRPAAIPSFVKYSVGGLLWVVVIVYLATAGRWEQTP